MRQQKNMFQMREKYKTPDGLARHGVIHMQLMDLASTRTLPVDTRTHKGILSCIALNL